MFLTFFLISAEKSLKTFEMNKKSLKTAKKVFQPAFGCVQRPKSWWSKYTTLGGQNGCQNGPPFDNQSI